MFKFAPALAGLVLALLVPAAQAAVEPWPSDGQNQFNTRNAKQTGPTGVRATKDLVKVWARTFDSPVMGTPIISNTGGVYFATENGEVWAIRRKDGVKYWEQFANGSKPAQVEGSVLKGPNSVFVVLSTATGAYLAALEPFTGDVQWRTQIDANPDADSCGGPQYSATHDAVIVGLGACRAERNHTASTLRGSVVSVNATTGALNWKTYTVSALAKGGGVSGTPVVWDGGDKAFVTTGHGYGTVADPNTDSFLRINLTNGIIDGAFQAVAGDTSNNGVVDPGKRSGFSTSSPLAFTAKDKLSYLGAGAEDGNFYIVDPLTMTSRYAVRLAGPGDVLGVASSAGWDPITQRIIGITQTPGLYFGINQGTGSVAWIFPSGDLAHRGPVSIADNAIWSTDMAGFVEIEHRNDGRFLGRYPIGGPSVGGVSFYQDIAYVAQGVPSGLIPDAPSTGAVYALK